MNENTELIDAINRLEESITKIDEMRYRIIRIDEVVTLGVAKISAAIDKMIADGLMARSALSVATDVQVANQESIVLKPREIATLDFAKKEGNLNSNQWREILDYWKKGGFSFAKTQASVSLVFAKLLKVGALKEIESFHGGSKIFQLTSIGESFLIHGKKRLHSQKKNPNSHQPWDEKSDKKLWDDVSQYRDPYNEIPNGKIVEWAKREGRSNNAIRSRINKYDYHEKTSKPYNKSYLPFEKAEIKIIREAMKQNMNKRLLYQHLSEKLDRSPLIVKVMIHLYT